MSQRDVGASSLCSSPRPLITWSGCPDELVSSLTAHWHITRPFMLFSPRPRSLAGPPAWTVIGVIKEVDIIRADELWLGKKQSGRTSYRGTGRGMPWPCMVMAWLVWRREQTCKEFLGKMCFSSVHFCLWYFCCGGSGSDHLRQHFQATEHTFCLWINGFALAVPPLRVVSTLRAME